LIVSLTRISHTQALLQWRKASDTVRLVLFAYRSHAIQSIQNINFCRIIEVMGRYNKFVKIVV